MTPPLRLRQIDIIPLRIPLRLRFEHAAAARDTADPVIVRITAAAPYATFAGFGETLARDYVTGESAVTVQQDIQRLFAPLLAHFSADSFPNALEFIDALPMLARDRVITAARAAVEIALLDLAGRVFRRRLADVAGWIDLPGFSPPGCLPTARYSGVVIGRRRSKLAWLLRAQYLYGLRDFKIKVATDGWQERLAWTYEVLKRPLLMNKATLRADANAGWTRPQAVEAVHTLEHYGVSAIEQPLPDACDDFLPELAGKTKCALIADESLVTPDDGRRLIEGGGVRVFNIRLAKNGGMLPSLRLARMALAAGLDVQLGCLVGETSLLSAAGVAFLECCPRVRFVEGAFGRLLLKSDITRPVVRFGYGGRVQALRGFGLGVQVREDALGGLSPTGVRTVTL